MYNIWIRYWCHSVQLTSISVLCFVEATWYLQSQKGFWHNTLFLSEYRLCNAVGKTPHYKHWIILCLLLLCDQLRKNLWFQHFSVETAMIIVKNMCDGHYELNQAYNERFVLHLVPVCETLYCNHLLLCICVWGPCTV